MPDTLASKEVVDHILKHHGVLGMKWGVHRSGGSGESSSSEVSVKTSSGRGRTKIRTSGGKGLPPHPDAIAAKVVGQKLKKSGLHTLSNEELQKFATRKNLESQVKKTGAADSTYTKGTKVVNHILSKPEGKAALKTVTSPAAKKAVKRILATAGTTAAVAMR